jgi:hypothetical protein
VVGKNITAGAAFADLADLLGLNLNVFFVAQFEKP